jgi:hypothetical protein
MHIPAHLQRWQCAKQWLQQHGREVAQREGRVLLPAQQRAAQRELRLAHHQPQLIQRQPLSSVSRAAQQQLQAAGSRKQKGWQLVRRRREAI